MTKTIILIQITLSVFLLYCWSINLYRFTQCDFKPSYKTEIIYGLGIVAPISVVTVWIDFEEK